MVTFTTFVHRLPDPTFGIGDAGNLDNTTTTRAPGFASVSVTSNRPVQASKTVSGRGVQSSNGQQYWEITINYNPMKRDDFDIVSSFLDARNGKLNPFYVVLPQYSKPKDATFAAFAAANVFSVNGNHNAGSLYLNIHGSSPINGSAKPGDFITITDSGDVNHQKAYKVVRVETNSLYQSGTTQPATNELRIWTMPPLTRFTNGEAVVNWINPQFRVIQKADVLEYALDTNNTYQFQLQLEETVP